jgi:hypothetical protein
VSRILLFLFKAISSILVLIFLKLTFLLLSRVLSWSNTWVLPWTSIYITIMSSTIYYRLLSTIVYYYLLSSTIYYRLLSTIAYYLSSSATVYCRLLSSTIVYYRLLSSTIVYCRLLSPTIVYYYCYNIALSSSIHDFVPKL